mgnify:CR=1 FL=1
MPRDARSLAMRVAVSIAIGDAAREPTIGDGCRVQHIEPAAIPQRGRDIRSA